MQNFADFLQVVVLSIVTEQEFFLASMMGTMGNGNLGTPYLFQPMHGLSAGLSGQQGG
jgi:hypothetical protein